MRCTHGARGAARCLKAYSHWNRRRAAPHRVTPSHQIQHHAYISLLKYVNVCTVMFKVVQKYPGHHTLDVLLHYLVKYYLMETLLTQWQPSFFVTACVLKDANILGPCSPVITLSDFWNYFSNNNNCDNNAFYHNKHAYINIFTRYNSVHTLCLTDITGSKVKQ